MNAIFELKFVKNSRINASLRIFFIEAFNPVAEIFHKNI